VPAVDDARNVRFILGEAITPGPIVADASEKPKPSATDQVSNVPPFGRCGQKRLHTVARRPHSSPQTKYVMTQVEHPPSHGPRSPLDLVAIEIIFGRIFEAFQQMSQAAAAADDKPLQKRPRRIPLKKVLPSRYLQFLFLTCDLLLF
jgi:hypothetical protein